MPKTDKPIVRWSSVENDAVAREAARIRVEESVGTSDALFRAQDVLPEQRRRLRTAFAPSIATHLHQMVDIFVKQMKEDQAKHAQPPVPAAPLVVQPQRMVGTPSPQPTQTLVHAISTMLGDLIADIFNGAMAHAQARLQAAQPVQATTHQPPAIEPPRHNPVPIPDLKPNRPRILIAGLIGPQIEELKKTYKDRPVELRFWQSQEKHDQLKKLAESADTVIGTTKFMDHSAERHVKTHMNYKRVNGAVSEIKRTLDRLIGETS